MSQKLKISAADRVGLGCRMSCGTRRGKDIALLLHLEGSEENGKNVSGGLVKDEITRARF